MTFQGQFRNSILSVGTVLSRCDNKSFPAICIEVVLLSNFPSKVYQLSIKSVSDYLNMMMAMPRVHRTVMDMVLTRTQRLVLSRRRRNSARKMDCVIGMALPVLI